MNISTLWLLGSLLVSAGACANGNIPVLELDFTRAATETLKQHGINDACIIAAPNPQAFTYCREGSATLYKYQALDLNQPSTPFNSNKPSTIDNLISIAEANSLACAEDLHKPQTHTTIASGSALGLIILFVFIGLRYTYRATMDGRVGPAQYSPRHIQQPPSSPHSNHSTTRALGAFVIAAGVAFIYFGYTTFSA